MQDDGGPIRLRAQALKGLRAAELPDGVAPQLGPFATPIGEAYRYTLEGAGGDPRLPMASADSGAAAGRGASRQVTHRRSITNTA